MQAHPLSTPAARNQNPSGTVLSIAEGPGLAHDAGNLLGALGLYCDLLDLPGVLRPEHLHYARELRLLSQRSGALINRLLEGDRDHVAPIVGPPPKRLCPSTVVRAFAPVLRSLAAPDATVSLEVSSGLPVLPFAAEVLERILVNLTRNAATALRTNGPSDTAARIRIAVRGDATRLSLTVADNGPGMPPEVAAAFLKPEPLPRGTLHGIGHRVIDDLVQSTGGQLSINAVPNRGTTLRIDWPISPTGIKIVARRVERRAAVRATTSIPSPGRTSKRTTREGAALSC
jgi:light-regulated signal transduction histidine kinase (bacteriophytochrome)